MIDQGTFEDLRARNPQMITYVTNEEQLQPSSDTDSDVQDQNPKPKSNASTKAKQASASETADLARRIGDLSVYNYYLKSTGWKVALTNAVTALVWTVGSNFPRESQKRSCVYLVNPNIALWLTWYADHTVQEVGLFIGIYVTTAVVALSAATGLL